MMIMVTSQKIPCVYCYTQCPQPCSRPIPTHTSTRDSWIPTDMSGTVFCGVTAPFSRVLVHKVLLCRPRVHFLVRCRFWQLNGGLITASSRGLLPLPSLLHPEPLHLWQTTAGPHVQSRRSNTGDGNGCRTTDHAIKPSLAYIFSILIQSSIRT